MFNKLSPKNTPKFQVLSLFSIINLQDLKQPRKKYKLKTKII